MLKNKQLLSSLMLVFLFLSRVYPDSDIFSLLFIYQEKILCRVCFDEQINMVLLPCRHHVLCRYLHQPNVAIFLKMGFLSWTSRVTEQIAFIPIGATRIDDTHPTSKFPHLADLVSSWNKADSHLFLLSLFFHAWQHLLWEVQEVPHLPCFYRREIACIRCVASTVNL